jgi:hypothetical protein
MNNQMLASLGLFSLIIPIRHIFVQIFTNNDFLIDIVECYSVTLLWWLMALGLFVVESFSLLSPFISHSF